MCQKTMTNMPFFIIINSLTDDSTDVPTVPKPFQAVDATHQSAPQGNLYKSFEITWIDIFLIFMS